MDDEILISEHIGPRGPLRALFELAEDSATELDTYLPLGRVWTARHDQEVIGHVQVVDVDDDTAEITNMAVAEAWQRQGIGARLIQAVAEVLAGESIGTVLVATAAADIGNLRFYQRQGFRLRAVERDAFTPAHGYPPGLLLDGIPLRDRVWLDRPPVGRALRPDAAGPRRRL